MRLMSLALLLCFQEAAVTVTVETRDGNVLVGTPDVAAFRIESSLGQVDIKLEDINSIRIADGIASVVVSDGTTVRGKIFPESWKVKTRVGEFAVKTPDLLSVRVSVSQTAGPPPDTPREEMPKASGQDALKPAKVINLDAAPTRILASADGKRFFVMLDSDAGSKVLVIDAASFGIEKEIALVKGKKTISLSPSGSLLFANGWRSIDVVDLAEGKVTKSFDIEYDTEDIVALDDENLIAACWANLVTIGISKQAVTGRFGCETGPFLFRQPDGRKIYAYRGALFPAGKATDREEMGWCAYSGGPFSGRGSKVAVSPDGRFVVCEYGIVCRIGKSAIADMAEVARLERNNAAAFLPSKKRLVLFADGGAREYDTDTFEQAASWKLGFVVTWAFVDEAGMLYACGWPPGSSPRGIGTGVAAEGGLLKFELPK